MDEIASVDGLAFRTLVRLQTLLSREFALESCLAWREGNSCKVLLVGHQRELAGSSKGEGSPWYVNDPSCLGYAVVRLRTSQGDDDPATRLGFTMAFAIALAEIAETSGLGLRICRWSAAFQPS